jgi:hypothetical protein
MPIAAQFGINQVHLFSGTSLLAQLVCLTFTTNSQLILQPLVQPPIPPQPLQHLPRPYTATL